MPGGRTSQSGVGAGDADTQPQGSASGSDGAMFAPPASAPSSTSNAREASPETPSRPLALLRVQILRARNLTAKDRNGKSDPFVVLSLPGTAPAPGGRNYRRQTPVIPKTLDPEWNATETTYEFEVIPEWYGPHGAAATRAAHELPEAPVDEYFPPEGGEAGGEDPEAGVQSSASSRSGSKRNISGAASRLFTPMRKLPRGAAAKVQAVRRSTPRPMRLRRGFSTATMTGGPGRQGVGPSVPEGSAQLNAHGHSHGAVGALEFVLWDKDRFSGNDYLGECSLPVDAWCAGARASANWDASEVSSDRRA